MILDQISYLDCLVFLLFLTPQLLLRIGLWRTARWLLPALPSICIMIPYQIIRDRYYRPFELSSSFAQRATFFQDLVIRYVRYAFRYMPASMGRVFLSKDVALPFLRFRMLRHGNLFPSPKWYEVNNTFFKGLWIIYDVVEEPDIVIYYCHGGGFSMGSSYFYLEFLLAWVTLLKEVGYQNPALFALDYSLVPDAVFPTQLQETMAGYEWVLSKVRDPCQICVSGDSAGAILILSFLLYASDHPVFKDCRPELAILISPWVKLVSGMNVNTASDYLDSDSLERYGREYCGPDLPLHDPLASPGHCEDKKKWEAATPRRGWHFVFGSEEVLARGTRMLIRFLDSIPVQVGWDGETGLIHAWPVASFYLGETTQERLAGLGHIIDVIVDQIPVSGSSATSQDE